jgi:hypothetical protein
MWRSNLRVIRRSASALLGLKMVVLPWIVAMHLGGRDTRVIGGPDRDD